MAALEFDYNLGHLAREREAQRTRERLQSEDLMRWDYSRRLRAVNSKQRPVRKAKNERKW